MDRDNSDGLSAVTDGRSSYRIRRIFALTSFRGRLILLSLGIALLSSLIVAGMNYAYIAKLTRESAIEGLAAEVRLFGARFADVFGDFEEDANILSHVTAIGGIARSIDLTDGIDPLHGLTTEEWSERLETVFVELLRIRPHYTQLRYIGTADDGREVVRVDRAKDEPKRISSDQLQQKGDEVYFQRSLELQPGESLISEVTYNREHGSIDLAMTPTIRMIVPVFDDHQTIVGLVVINADYPKLLQRAVSGLLPQHVITVLNDSGDYLESDPSSDQLRFHFHELSDWTASPFLSVLQHSDDREGVVFDGGDIAYFVRLSVGSSSRPASVGIVATVPEDVILAEASASLRRNLAVAALLVLAATLGAVLIGAAFTRPLSRLTEEITTRGSNTALLRLPVDAPDEIGDLARSFQDLSNDLIRSHRNAKNSEAHLRELLATAPVGIISVDDEGVIVSANEMVAATFGYERQELVGRPVEILIPSRFRDGHNDLCLHFITSGQKEFRTMVSDRKVTGLYKDGTESQLEVRLSRVVMPDGSIEVVATLQDVNERLELEAQRKRYQAALERSNRDLDDFATIASHDLKEPLRGIHNHATTLLEDYQDQLDPEGRKRLDRMMSLSQRMERLIADLLFFSQLRKAGQTPLPVDLEAVIDDIRTSHAEMLQRRNADIVVKAPLPSVLGHAPYVTALFQNLIGNGTKYNDSETKVVEIGMAETRRAANDDAFRTFFVRDNGIGIDEPFQDDVFRIFKRLNSEKAYGPGTGAGLSFVKKIVENLGGDIWLVSKVGEGTTFYFTLPVVTESAEESGDHQAA